MINISKQVKIQTFDSNHQLLKDELVRINSFSEKDFINDLVTYINSYHTSINYDKLAVTFHIDEGEDKKIVFAEVNK